MKRKLATVVLLFSLISCDMEKDVEYIDRDRKPKLVLNSICSSDSDSHIVSLGISRPIFNNVSGKDSLISPTVTVRHNDTTIPVLLKSINKDRAEYKFNAIFEAGDKVEIEAASYGFDNIYGVSEFPSKAAIDGVRTSWYKEDGVDKLRISVDITDIQDQQNYYRVVVKTKSVILPLAAEEERWETKEIDISQDQIFTDYVGPTSQISPNYYRVFSDRVFSDGNYTLKFSINFEPASSWTDFTVVNYLRIELHNLKEPLFQYLNSISLAHNLDYYSEPVAIYSNISNGFGIIGTYSITSMELQLND